MTLPMNQIICGDCLEVLRDRPSETESRGLWRIGQGTQGGPDTAVWGE